MYFTRARLMKYTEDELHVIWGLKGFTQERLRNKTKEDIINFILDYQKATQIPVIGFFRRKVHEMIDKMCNTQTQIRIDTHPNVIDIPETEDEKYCVICQEFRKVFAGKCGHLALCGKCSKEIWSKAGLCPICREPWINVRQIFI